MVRLSTASPQPKVGPASAPSEKAAPKKQDCDSNQFKSQTIKELHRNYTSFVSDCGQAWIVTEHTDGHRETVEVRSEAFRRFLINLLLDQDKIPSDQTISDIIDRLAIKIESEKTKETKQRPVGTRILRIGDTIYIDLGNADWEYIEISPARYDIKKIGRDSPIAFRRSAFTKPLPRPLSFEEAKGADIELLFELMNTADDQSKKMVGIFLLMALRGKGPYPILTLSGNEGSGKSTAAEMIHRCIDPSVNILAAPPKSEDDLCVLAENSFVVSLENMSGYARWLPDLLCRLATGFSFTKRRLYTNNELFSRHLENPIILNGIDVNSTRGDLASRICAARFQKKMNDGKEEFDPFILEKFDKAQPRILGALYRGVSAGLKAEKEARND